MNIVHLRTPKQSRSRESFDRVTKAATDVLISGGLRALTLTEVSRRSRVSIGSIYGRVKSKEDLIRVVQAHALEAMDLECAAFINRIRRRSVPLQEMVPALIREVANFHRRHAPLLNAFIERGQQDPTVAARGRKSYGQLMLDFKLLLLERRSEFHHAAPEQAVETSFIVVYGVVARYLGLAGGHSESGVGEGDWKRLIDDLGLMVLAFLVVDLQVATRAAAKAR